MYWLQLFLWLTGISNTRGEGHIIEVKWLRWKTQGHILKSLALASKVKDLASKPQVLENFSVLGSRTALFFFERLKCSWKTPETSRNIREDFFCFPLLEITWKIFLKTFLFVFFFRRSPENFSWRPFFWEHLHLYPWAEHSPLASDLFCVLGLEPCVLDSIDLRFSKCSLRRPRAPLKKPRVSATDSFTLFLV